MAVSPEYRDFILEMLEPFNGQSGPVSFRPMFGGGGLFINDVMFALMTRSDVLYFRTDEQNKPDYETAGMGPFVTNAEKNTTMPYHEVPADVIEDPEEMCIWALKALEAARRARIAKPKTKKREK